MAAAVSLRFGSRRVEAARVAVAIAALAAGTTAAWPWLAAAPFAGGPIVALAAGSIGWLVARTAAPQAHANDNAPLAVSSVFARRDGPSPQRPGANAMVNSNDKAAPRRAGGLSVIGADVTVTGTIDAQRDLPIDGRMTRLVEGRAASESPLRPVVASEAG